MLSRVQPSTTTPDITDRLGRNAIFGSNLLAEKHASSSERFARFGAGSQLEYLNRLKACELLPLGALGLELLLHRSRFLRTALV